MNLQLKARKTRAPSQLAAIVGHEPPEPGPQRIHHRPYRRHDQPVHYKTGWSKDEVDLFDINEPVANVTMLAMREHGLDPRQRNILRTASLRPGPSVALLARGIH